MAVENAPVDSGILTDPELYKELKEGLLKVFRNNVRNDREYAGYREYPSYGQAAAQAAMALLQLEKQKPPGVQ